MCFRRVCISHVELLLLQIATAENGNNRILLPCSAQHFLISAKRVFMAPAHSEHSTHTAGSEEGSGGKAAGRLSFGVSPTLTLLFLYSGVREAEDKRCPGDGSGAGPERDRSGVEAEGDRAVLGNGGGVRSGRSQ